VTTSVIENTYRIAAEEEGNDYLAGIFRPVEHEITATDMVVIGEIPADLDGTYIRNGHNPILQPQSGRYHWFDGDSMVHSTAFKDGKAVYRNRMVLTAGLLSELEAGRGLFPGLRDGFEAEEGLKNNSGTDVVLHNGEFKTMFSRCGQPYRLDPETLATIGPDTFGGEWTKGVSAHSKVDERTGELIFFNYSFNTAPFMEYGVVGADGILLHSTEIELPGPRLPHDCWLTENYTVLHDYPVYWDPDLLKQRKKKLTFNRDLPSRYGVIPRHGSGDQIRWFEGSPGYMLHTVNAWEDGDEIVAYGYLQHEPVPTVPADTPRVKTPNYFLSFVYTQPRLTEFRFNLKNGVCTERQVDDECFEMPGINNRLMGLKTRYSYNTRVADIPFFLAQGIQKFDYELMTEVARYELPDGKYMGQPVFAARTGGVEEDDGYLVAYVADADSAEVYIWDARAIEKGPLARVLLPQRVPGGSHAYWARGEDIRQGRARRARLEATETGS